MTAIARKKRTVRTTPRVKDNGSKNAEAAKPAKPRTTTKRSSAQVRKLEQPEGALMEVTYTCSELVPVAQYANVSVGPIQVTRTYVDPGTEDDAVELIEEAIRQTGEAAQTILGEDREIVEESVRQHNARDKENEKGRRGGR